jgi:hypothetical protein
MAAATDKPPTSAAAAVAAFVEPLKAGAAILGFAVGFLATYRSGGGMVECTLHALLGALLLGPVGWFLGLVLMREAIRANVEDQRTAHDVRVHEAKRQLAEQLQAAGRPVPPELAAATAGNQRGLPPGG